MAKENTLPDMRARIDAVRKEATDLKSAWQAKEKELFELERCCNYLAALDDPARVDARGGVKPDGIVESFAAVIDGAYKNQTAFVKAVLPDGICVCKIGEDEMGREIVADIPATYLQGWKPFEYVRGMK